MDRILTEPGIENCKLLQKEEWSVMLFLNRLYFSIKSVNHELKHFAVRHAPIHQQLRVSTVFKQCLLFFNYCRFVFLFDLTSAFKPDLFKEFTCGVHAGCSCNSVQANQATAWNPELIFASCTSRMIEKNKKWKQEPKLKWTEWNTEFGWWCFSLFCFNCVPSQIKWPKYYENKSKMYLWKAGWNTVEQITYEWIIWQCHVYCIWSQNVLLMNLILLIYINLHTYYTLDIDSNNHHLLKLSVHGSQHNSIC